MHTVDLIDRMLVVNPKDRYDIDQCLDHPWTKADVIINANDSTGLIGDFRGLDVGRRGVTRQRTLLAKINSIHEERVAAGDQRGTVGVFSAKGKVKGANDNHDGSPGNAGTNSQRLTNIGAPMSPRTPQPRPGDARRPKDFVKLGGVGDQVLYGSDEDGGYHRTDVTDSKRDKKKR